MSGWIKLHRQIVNWEWYSDSKTFRLFLHLLLTANHKDNNYRGKLIKKGCLVTGRELLSAQTGMSVREIRTCLERLKSTNEIAIKTNSKGTEIQVINYEKYQSTTNETTNERPTNDQRTTTNKNDKNDKEEKENKSFDIFWNIYNKKIDTRKCKDKFEKLSEKERLLILDVVQAYVNSQPDVKFRKNPLTWLNGKCWNDELENNSIQENNVTLAPVKNDYKSYFE